MKVRGVATVVHFLLFHCCLSLKKTRSAIRIPCIPSIHHQKTPTACGSVCHIWCQVTYPCDENAIEAVQQLCGNLVPCLQTHQGNWSSMDDFLAGCLKNDMIWYQMIWDQMIWYQNDMRSNDMRSNDMISNDMISNDMRSNDMISNDMISNDMISNDMRSNDMISNDMISNDMVSNDMVLYWMIWFDMIFGNEKHNGGPNRSSGRSLGI